MGLVPLEKAPQSFPLLLRPYEDTAKSWSSMTWEADTYQTQNLKTVLDLASGTVRNIFFLYKSASLWYFVIAARID